MIQRAKRLWESIRSSLWALPLAMVCVAAVIAVLAAHIRLRQGSDPVWWLYSGDAKEAPQFLSDLVSSMITMATLAISITMVVLALAAQQLGPRLIQNFMGDKQTQVTLGLFISTVIYLLLILRTTYGAGDSAPNLAVTIGTALVFVSVLALPIFVHHLARSIVADNIIKKIGTVLDGEIGRLLPQASDAPQPATPSTISHEGGPIRSSAGGYVQAIDFDRLVRVACKHDAVILLDIRAGDHIIAGMPIGRMMPAAKDDIEDDVGAAILLGGERTPMQDLEYSIRQLVEIAVRALSPGINDPYTAIAAMDRLTQSVGLVMTCGAGKQVWEDDEGRVRAVVPVSNFDGIVDVAFHQIRQQAESTPAVLIRLADNLAKLLDVSNGAQRRTLERHLRLVLNAGERGFDDEADRRVLRARAEAAMPAADSAGCAARAAASD